MRNKTLWPLLVLVMLISCTHWACSSSDLKKSLAKGKDIIIQDQTFDESIDLTQLLTFASTTTTSQKAVVKSRIVFKNCQFNGFIASAHQNDQLLTIVFENDVIFEHCLFNGDTDLSYAQVNGSFVMRNCEFGGLLKLNNARFNGTTSSFIACIFNDKVKAINTRFMGRTSFMESTFNKSVSFQRARFMDDAQFGATEFKAYAGFDQAYFMMGGFFDKSTFYDAAIFNASIFYITASFVETKFLHSVDFDNASIFGKTDFSATTLPAGYILTQQSLVFNLPIKN